MLFIPWLYGKQNRVRPMFPKDTGSENFAAASRMFDLAPQMPPVDWSVALTHLPVLRIEVSSSNFPRFDRNLNTGGNNYDE